MTEREKILDMLDMLDEKLDRVDSEINETKHNLYSLEDKRKRFLEKINKLYKQRIE